MSADAAPRLVSDRGAGLVSTMTGFLVFLIFLLFACQLLIGLFARSAVAAAAFDGAHSVAVQGGIDPSATASARATAEQRMRDLLGRAGDDASFDWSGTDADWVQVRVQMPAPRFGWPGFGGTPSTIDRVARVRVEDLR